MSRSGQMRVSRTESIPSPNAYVVALKGEFSPWSYHEEQAPKFCGEWRSKAFSVREAARPLDLEIGTGNGLHFANRAHRHPERLLLGLELRYKPLIQSIRRALDFGCTNARIARYNAALLPEIFTPGELNDVFIYFPDPWERQRDYKHRLIQTEFLEKLFIMQRPGSRVFFKTDSRDYFLWSLSKFEKSPYGVDVVTHDLHQSEYREHNFITQFEKIFIRQGIPIGYAQLSKSV